MSCVNKILLKGVNKGLHFTCRLPNYNLSDQTQYGKYDWWDFARLIADYYFQSMFCLFGLLGDIGLPKSLQCGGAETMLNQVFLWMNSGGTKSVLYKDRFETFECLLDGKIDLILINKVNISAVECLILLLKNTHSSVENDRMPLPLRSKNFKRQTYKQNICITSVSI